MRIVFMGAGGIGGYFGARLIAAGVQVGFVARGAHAQAMRERGLRVRSPQGDFAVPTPHVHEDPAVLASQLAPELVVFAVKLPDAEAAAQRLAALVGPDTVVLPLQNGVEAAELLARHVPARAVALGLAYIPTKIAEPGVIEHGGGFARLRFGALHAGQQPVLEAFLAACGRAGIEAEMPADIRLASWEKFVFLTGLSSLTALTREAVGVVRAHAPTHELLHQVMREATARSRRGRAAARGLRRPPDGLCRHAACRHEGLDAARPGSWPPAGAALAGRGSGAAQRGARPGHPCLQLHLRRAGAIRGRAAAGLSGAQAPEKESP
jgi:2-dehydropantoate 2-reductase